MPEKKIGFGETPFYGGRTLKEGIKDEKEKEGYAYAGEEYLTENDLKPGVIEKVIKNLEKKYKKMKNAKEVKLMINPRDKTEVWVFLKTK